MCCVFAAHSSICRENNTFLDGVLFRKNIDRAVIFNWIDKTTTRTTSLSVEQAGSKQITLANIWQKSLYIGTSLDGRVCVSISLHAHREISSIGVFPLFISHLMNELKHHEHGQKERVEEEKKQGSSKRRERERNWNWTKKIIERRNILFTRRENGWFFFWHREKRRGWKREQKKRKKKRLVAE